MDHSAPTVGRLLQESGIPRNEAEILLSYLLHKDRTLLLAHPEYELSPDETAAWEKCVDRRKSNEPVAYITGEKEFFGRKFLVGRRVLIPRPSTEKLVEVALEFFKQPQRGLLNKMNNVTLSVSKSGRVTKADSGIVIVEKIFTNKIAGQTSTVVDVGTGSGCIAITLACERPDLKIIATDISEDALAVAKENAVKQGIADRIQFLQGRGLEPVKNLQQPFILVSNPPYIPEGEILQPDVFEYEPHEALFAGKDGTNVLQSLMKEAETHPFCAGVIVECREDQMKNLKTSEEVL